MQHWHHLHGRLTHDSRVPDFCRFCFVAWAAVSVTCAAEIRQRGVSNLLRASFARRTGGCSYLACGSALSHLRMRFVFASSSPGRSEPSVLTRFTAPASIHCYTSRCKRCQVFLSGCGHILHENFGKIRQDWQYRMWGTNLVSCVSTMSPSELLHLVLGSRCRTKALA